ncbi:MAG: tetratricopeptide repeat protein [Spirochaetes bacterium]|nr:tetratricopeptide repeat protein [Spirochaetota bacterium]
MTTTMKKGLTIIIAIAALMAGTVPLMAGYYEQARHHYIRKHYDKAKELFLKAAEDGSGNAYYFLGEIERMKENYKEAEEYYKNALSMQHISKQYLINSYWNAVLMAEQRNDYNSVVSMSRSMWIRSREASARQKIESLINKLLWSDNNDAIERYNQGIDLKKAGKAAEAEKKFEEAIGIDYSFLAPKFEIGMAAYRNGNPERAAAYLDAIAARIPFYAEVRLILGDIQFERHNYRGAIDHFDRVLEFGLLDSSTEYRVWMKRGTCYYNLNDNRNAENDIEKAMKRNPRATEPLLLMSAIQIKLGKYDEALRVLKKANAIEPDNPEIHYQMGSVYYKEGDDRYVASFDRLFTLAGGKKGYPPKYKKVFVILAKRLHENKKHERAIAILKSLDEQSQTFETRLLAAKSYYYKKEYDNAIDQFEKLSLGNDARYMLCKAYAQSGRREKAKSLLAELAQAGDYLSRARHDPVLSGIARELDGSAAQPDGPETETEPEKKPEPVKKDAGNTKEKEAGVDKSNKSGAPASDDEEVDDDTDDESRYD